MKRLVIAALAIGALAACTKSNVQLEQPGEISFQPVAQKATKAAVDGNAYPTDAAYNFNVWAWWGADDAGTALDSFEGDTPYIAEGTFEHRGSGSWGGSTPYYWPTKGSLVFAGYSPASATGTFKYELASKTFTVTDYVQSNNIAATNDLMWFDVTDKSYDKNANKNKNDVAVNGVPVVFKHALSWLTFKFNLKSKDTAPNWKVTKVELKGIETQADCKIVKGSTPVWEYFEIPNEANLTDDEKEEAKTVTIYYKSDGKVISYADSQDWTNGDAQVSDYGGTVLEGTHNGVIVIPQSCVLADAKLVVDYQLKNPAGNPEYIDQKNVELELTTDTDGNYWQPGKHYIYTIVFGADEILIVPEVAEWIEEAVEVEVIK